MPTPASPETNQFHCKSCGRFFNEKDEFEKHERECAARQSRTQTEPPDFERDREWTSVP
jgi:hypothetical protein